MATADAGPTGATTRMTKGIPPIFHQIWFDFGRGEGPKVPPRYRDIRRTWRVCHPRAKHLLWTFPRACAFVKRHFPQVYPHFRKYRQPVHQTDVFRLLVLARMGGIYADMDCRCLAPWDEMLQRPDVRLVVVYHTKMQVHSNWCMASEPHHPFLQACVRVFEQQPWWHRLCNCKYSTLGTLWLAGPYFVHSLLRKTKTLADPTTRSLPHGRPFAQHYGEGTWWLSYSANNICDVIRALSVIAAVVITAIWLSSQWRRRHRLGKPTQSTPTSTQPALCASQ